MNSEQTKPDGRKLLIITVASVIVAIILSVLMQTMFSSTGKTVVDEDTESDEETSTDIEAHETLIPDEDIMITVSAVGDIMVHDAQLNSMFDNETNDYNFNPAFDKVRDVLSDSDLTIGNMYGVFAGAENTHSGYPSFNTPDTMASALESAGFDLIVAANATSLNFGFDGVSRTYEVLTNAGITPVGIYEEGLDEAGDENIVYVDVDGILIAFVAYTEKIDGYNDEETTFDQAADRVGIMSEGAINGDMAKIRKKNPDFVIAYMNWGVEFQYEVTAMQERYTNLLVDNGVDVIVGAYPHNIQRTQYVAGGGDGFDGGADGEGGSGEASSDEASEANETFIAYSLGNFFSNQRNETLGDGYEPTEDGVIMNFEITKAAGTGETTLSSVDYIPTWTYRYSENNQVPFVYEILPVEETLASDDDEYNEDVMRRLDDSLIRTDVRLNLNQARNPSVDTSGDGGSDGDGESDGDDGNQTEESETDDSDTE